MFPFAKLMRMFCFVLFCLLKRMGYVDPGSRITITYVYWVQFSHSVMSDYLPPYGLQNSRLPCPSPVLGAYSNSCPSSWWCHPAISSFVIPFSCPQTLPASESFSMSQLFSRGGQNIGVSALASVLSMNTQDWSRLGWTDWTSLHFKGFSNFSNTTV